MMINTKIMLKDFGILVDTCQRMDAVLDEVYNFLDELSVDKDLSSSFRDYCKTLRDKIEEL
jgi:hypothetical protein